MPAGGSAVALPSIRDNSRIASISAVAATAAAPSTDSDTATRRDQIGRITVLVMVNGRGPFQFVLDTGANRTVLTPHLVETLGLQISREDTVTMSGVTGAAIVPTVFVERITAGDLALENQRLPVADALARDIDGVLGADGLSDKRVLADFVHHKLEIRTSRSVLPVAGITRTRTRFRFGLLMVTTGHVGAVRVNAVIDTGSEYTLGNNSLRVALDLPRDVTTSNSETEVIGQTLTRQVGVRLRVSDVEVAETRTRSANVVFGDFYMFKLWNLDKDPTLVVGMDLLGALDTLVIDYGRRDVQFRARTLRW